MKSNLFMCVFREGGGGKGSKRRETNITQEQGTDVIKKRWKTKNSEDVKNGEGKGGRRKK